MTKRGPRAKVGIIGTGNMGGALLRGLIRSATVRPAEIGAYDTDRDRLEQILSETGARAFGSHREAAEKSDLLILAVKPQVLPEVLAEIAGSISGLVISIAAGFRIHRIEKAIGKDKRVIRIMPNTPALIGAGVSVLAANSRATAEDRQEALRAFKALGEAIEVEKEEWLDAVTGLSGSGPAYVFVFLEALVDAGVREGLPQEAAFRLALQTVSGAARLVAETGRSPAALRDMVSSPGGTTLAGLAALERGRFRATIIEAVEAATRRSRELSGD